jgi:hypothetical protein
MKLVDQADGTDLDPQVGFVRQQGNRFFFVNNRRWAAAPLLLTSACTMCCALVACLTDVWVWVFVCGWRVC